MMPQLEIRSKQLIHDEATATQVKDLIKAALVKDETKADVSEEAKAK